MRGYLGPTKGGFNAIVNHVCCTGVDNFIVRNRAEACKVIKLFLRQKNWKLIVRLTVVVVDVGNVP